MFVQIHLLAQSKYSHLLLFVVWVVYGRFLFSFPFGYCFAVFPGVGMRAFEWMDEVKNYASSEICLE